MLPPLQQISEIMWNVYKLAWGNLITHMSEPVFRNFSSTWKCAVLLKICQLAPPKFSKGHLTQSLILAYNTKISDLLAKVKKLWVVKGWGLRPIYLSWLIVGLHHPTSWTLFFHHLTLVLYAFVGALAWTFAIYTRCTHE